LTPPPTSTNLTQMPTKERTPMHRPIRLTSLLLGVIACALLLAPGAQAASAPAPGWRITMTPQPSNFTSARNSECETQIEAEGQYPLKSQTFSCERFLVSVRNEGAEASAEGSPATMSVELPSGLTLVGLGEANTAQGAESHEVPLPLLICEIATSSCTLESTLDPGGVMAFVALVTVAPSLEGQTVSASAVVEGGGAPAAAVSIQVPVSTTPSPFAYENVALDPLGLDGLTEADAGGHLGSLTTSFTLPTEFRKAAGLKYIPREDPKDVVFDLPLGLTGNPQSLPTCPEQSVRNQQCPADTQIGLIGLEISENGATGAAEQFPLYNIEPQKGYAAEFGSEFEHRDFFLYAEVVHTPAGYGLQVSTPGIVHVVKAFSLTGIYLTFWGDPASHDGTTGTTPFFSNPADCSAGPLLTTGWAVSWQQPDRVVQAEYASYPNGVVGCNQLSFEPTIRSRPSTNRADNPSGLNFDLHVPQASGMTNPATPPARDVTVALPKGMSIDPSSADGLGSCNAEGAEGINIGSQDISVQGQDLGDPEATEYGAGHSGGNGSPYDDGIWHTAPGHCPNASQIGTVEVFTPLLDHNLPGKVFVGTPECGPCTNADAASGKLVKLYMELNDPVSGVIVKLPGVVNVDPGSGQLTATFRDLPQLPFSKLHLQLNEGGRAPLRTPSVCTNYQTTSDLTPWSSPETPDARPGDAFAISSPAVSGSCPGSEAKQPNSPSFTAGTLSPQAGAYTPFVLKVSRDDGTQQFGSLEAALPGGLLAKLAGVPYCADASIAAANGRSGRAERNSPSCPSASEVGTVTVGAGAGPTPYYVQGHAYLAGPYKGAPLSLAIITPAVAGPFDLGTVVVRTALNVDPETAQVHAVSDPLPTILAGIPLDIRSIAVNLARPQFVLNPTSCDPTSVTGSLNSTLGSVVPLSQHFQVGGCNSLKFVPKLKLSLSGATKRTGHPALKAVLTYPQKGAYANIRRAQVNLPHAEFLDQGNLNKTCTKPILLAGNCPAKSIYGKAKAWTPLLDKPLEGPVYLVGGYGYKLPALVADLNGQIRVVLKGKVDTGPNKGIRNTFEAVPDAPVSRFELQLKGGKKYSLLENSENLCRKPQRAIARFTAQNGASQQTKPLIANDCGKGKKGNGKKGGGSKGKKKDSKHKS
jgi:hypothetical protein